MVYSPQLQPPLRHRGFRHEHRQFRPPYRPPPPALRALISGILLAAGILAAAPPATAQNAYTYTLTATADNGDRDPTAPGLQVDEGDIVTFTLDFSGSGPGVDISAWVFSGTAAFRDDYECATQINCGITRDSATATLEAAELPFSLGFTITNDAAPEPDETFTLAVPQVTDVLGSDTYTTASTDITVTIRQNDGYVAPVTPPVVTPGPGPGPAPGPGTDNPTARAERLEAPAAAAARGVGQLAAHAVQQRLRAGVGAGRVNSLTVAGRELAGAGAETLAAEYLAGGYFAGDSAPSAAELLRRSGFNLTDGDGVRGVSIWGSGGYVSADGDHEGVDYDGETSAFHLGGDTQWRDGLVGVAVSHSSGDIDFTVTADGMKSTLETTVTSVHPYLTRRINGSQLWLTAGYGSGDAELKEPDALIKTDITVTTAAFGINNRRGDLFTAGLSAQYNRAKLDAAESAGKTLPATTADTIRITANAETGWTHGAWRPFLNFALRHDSGDGNTGGAADLGGGVEWQTPTVLVRLAGSGHIQGQAADEQRATLTVRKSTGNFDLNLNLAADDAGLDTARLLHGEWRF